MTKEQIRPTILRIIARILPDEILSNPKGHFLIREQTGGDPMNPMDLIVELRKRYGIKASKHDYVQLATSDSSVAYLEPGTEQP